MNFNPDLLARMRMAGKSWRNGKAFAIPAQGSLHTDQLQNLTAVTELIQRTLNKHLPGLAKTATHTGSDYANQHDQKREQTLHDINPRPENKRDGQPQADARHAADVIDAQTPEAKKTDKSDTGRFISGSYANAHGKRTYKLYIPSGYTGQALPLIVMLHGCTQGPDDFATGTGMNLIAEQEQCIVVYPCQDQSANSSKCWNWFKAMDQKRDQGEPALIAGLTRKIMADYHADERRVFIAGMSAGGAMAAIMADAYPELYAAVGIHSGLPFGAANDLPSALAAMRGAASQSKKSSTDAAVPIIVFHGDQDHTVNSKNADSIMEAYLGSNQSKNLTARKENGSGKLGRLYTRTRYADNTASHQTDNVPAPAEQWVIHGAGHAWSGGNSQGSFTDAAGPDASREMLRFFLSQVSTNQM
ncbi:extracellular catalytic domain type 1 short-chain-length polyhydroxyalkanoate depolymerase [Undibacterium pigrum]|uniref:Poly(Hydroxyalkanoate) depolymerase family esterase n=1 Tax=Undibacterium pigrum TaxID=401470 RepID=A0A318JIV7_9BURK|nr:PHB depolymerase family esterase [Undibacterium pigrum]PXX47735.1 poly(hydroxyalkanoate) depolymerase family esterase [Undibacterium pigrum]